MGRLKGTNSVTFAVVVASTFAVALSAGDLRAEPTPRLWTEKVSKVALDPDAPVSMRAFSRLAKELSPAVVNISVERKGVALPMPFVPNGGTGLGTGFIINADGYVLTNNHVVTEADEITVKLWNDREYAAKIVGTYPPLDVALLKMEHKETLVVAPLGDSEALEIGEWVIAIGNPFGLNHTVTAGIVSAKGRRDVTPGNEPNHARFIQTDASINPGNSGGPLINIRGEVVGINTAINAAGQGIGFAVPIDMVKTVIAQLARGKVERSYLGVLVGPVTKELASSIGAERSNGALVTEVKTSTPASDGGILAGDVIVTFDGKPIDHWEDLPWLASTTGSAKSIKVVVNRQGKRVELAVKLAPFPEDGIATNAPGDTTDLGLVLAALPPARAVELGIEPGQGVLVKSTERSKIAAQIGLAKGDIITQVNYVALMGGPDGFARAVAGVPSGQPLALTIRRGDRFLFKVFTR